MQYVEHMMLQVVMMLEQLIVELLEMKFCCK